MSSAEQFKSAFRSHPGGVSVITADAGRGPVALTATSVSSVSAEPPMLMFSVSDKSSSTPTITAATTVVVHLLSSNEIDLAKLGATSGIDRFADRSIWTRLPTGEPHFPAATAWIRGKVVAKMSAGSSTVIAVEALEIKCRADEPHRAPLVYHDRSWHELGDPSRIS